MNTTGSGVDTGSENREKALDVFSMTSGLSQMFIALCIISLFDSLVMGKKEACGKTKRKLKVN